MNPRVLHAPPGLVAMIQKAEKTRTIMVGAHLFVEAHKGSKVWDALRYTVLSYTEKISPENASDESVRRYGEAATTAADFFWAVADAHDLIHQFLHMVCTPEEVKALEVENARRIKAHNEEVLRGMAPKGGVA